MWAAANAVAQACGALHDAGNSEGAADRRKKVWADLPGPAAHGRMAP